MSIFHIYSVAWQTVLMRYESESLSDPPKLHNTSRNIMYSPVLAVAVCFTCMLFKFATAQYGAPPSSQSSSAATPTSVPTPTNTPGHINVGAYPIAKK